MTRHLKGPMRTVREPYTHMLSSIEQLWICLVSLLAECDSPYRRHWLSPPQAVPPAVRRCAPQQWRGPQPPQQWHCGLATAPGLATCAPALACQCLATANPLPGSCCITALQQSYGQTQARQPASRAF